MQCAFCMRICFCLRQCIRALHSQIAFKDLPENVKKYLKRKFVDEEGVFSSLSTNNYAQAQFAKEQGRLSILKVKN